jgi:tetratricopeptide (TPR) repeat protein
MEKKMSDEKSRKELLEEPDPFLVFVGQAMEFGKTYQKQIVAGVTTLLIVVIAVYGVIYFKNKSEDRAAVMFGKALSHYSAILYRDPNIMNPKPPTAAEYEGVKKRFKEIVDKHAKTGSGKIALMHYADLCYLTKNYDEAIKAYTQALDEFGDNTEFKSLILNGLAYSYEGKKDFDKAVTYFEKIASDKDALMKDQAFFNLGRIYESLGKVKLMKDAFNRIVSDYPDSMYFELAREKVAG